MLDALNEKVLIYDGAMGTQIQAAHLTPADFTLTPRETYAKVVNDAAQRLDGKLLDGCNEILSLTRPDVIESIHGAYLEAGADLIETNTFGTTTIVLAEYEIEELNYVLSLESAKIARRAADKFGTTEKPRFVIGALGPGTRLVSLGQTNFDEIESSYCEAFRGLIEGGADGLLLETLQDLLMVKSAIVGANRAMAETEQKLPLFVQVTMEQTGTMLLGSELGAALNSIEAFPSVTGFGINCATGPAEMAPHVRYLAQNSTRPISVLPNAGLPMMENGRSVYKLSPADLAGFHERFTEEFGAAMVGGCCGTTPDHIIAVADSVGGKSHGTTAHWQQTRGFFPGFDFLLRSDRQAEALKLVGCSSLYAFQPYEQDRSFLIVGERTNANGSKAFREMLAKENWDGLTELAREQENEGSHLLDVCAAYVGRDEAADMRTLLGHYNRHITIPIMIDSTETPVMEIALKCLAGKPILNSINFEDGETRPRKVLGLAAKYGAAVVALTIDEDGMAKSVERKLEVAERLLALTREYKIADHDVFIDCLTFTLGSGDEEFRRSGMATVEAIRELRHRHPRVNTILGVSNVSFGLKPAARQVLNSAFLQIAREAGLTSAIVHFSKILPDNKIDPEVWNIATDLVYDRRQFANT